MKHLNHISIDNVFNYITKIVRENEGDDDQIKSWALQGLRNIDIPSLRTVRYFTILEYTNHKVKLPSNCDEVISVSLLSTDITTSIFSEYEDTVVDPNNDVFNEIMFNQCWYPLDRVETLDKNYFYNITNTQKIYSINDRTIIIPGQCDGCIRLVCRGLLSSECGDTLIADKPEALWKYMGAYASMMHFREQRDRRNEGTRELYREYQMEALGFLEDAKRIIIGGNIKVSLVKQLMYGEGILTRLPSAIINTMHYDSY